MSTCAVGCGALLVKGKRLRNCKKTTQATRHQTEKSYLNDTEGIRSHASTSQWISSLSPNPLGHSVISQGGGRFEISPARRQSKTPCHLNSLLAHSSSGSRVPCTHANYGYPGEIKPTRPMGVTATWDRLRTEAKPVAEAGLEPTAPRGSEPMPAQPNGFRVYLLTHSDTV